MVTQQRPEFMWKSWKEKRFVFSSTLRLESWARLLHLKNDSVIFQHFAPLRPSCNKITTNVKRPIQQNAHRTAKQLNHSRAMKPKTRVFDPTKKKTSHVHSTFSATMNTVETGIFMSSTSAAVVEPTRTREDATQRIRNQEVSNRKNL